MNKPIVFVMVHVRPSAQAVALGMATVIAALPASMQARVRQVELFLDQPIEDMLAAVVAEQPAMVAFSVYVWNHCRSVELAMRIRERLPRCLLLAGGPEITADTQAFERLKLFDSLVQGEGEPVIESIIADLDQERALKPVYQAQHVVDLARQHSVWLDGPLTVTPGVLWEISRGCPFNCSFCYDARGDHGVRTILVSRLEEELALFARSRVAQVWVLDSTFNYPVERGKELIRTIAAIAPHIHFHLEAKIEFIDEELAALLSTIHCSVQIGLQSANPQVVKQMHRHFDAELFQDKVALLSEAGITYGFDLMYGLPGDDESGLRRSLEFALGLQPNHVDIFPLAVLPGTELYRNRQRYGLESETVPPYRLLSSSSMAAENLAHCDDLAAVTDLFYNTGRATGYFLELCQAVNLTAVELLDAFGHWLHHSHGVSREQLQQTAWTAPQACSLQLQFFADWLNGQSLAALQPAIDDLIRFHACWAQAQLEEDLVEPQWMGDTNFSLTQQSWRCAESVQLQYFNYDLTNGLMAGIDVVELAEYGSLTGEIALFFRVDGEAQCVVIEGIDARNFPRDGRIPPLDDLNSVQAIIDEGDYLDWLQQAVDYGLLLPA